MPKTEGVIKNQSPAVGIGTKVLIEVNGELQSWEIVELGGSEIPNGKISRDAPLARCILGAREGDRINCKTVNNGVTIVIKRVSVLASIT